MTIALRGIVDLYRKANRSSEVHRRALGFSISHDDNSARIYAHYPELDGDNTTYWCDRIKELNFGDGKGKEKWKCHQFTLNVCQYFALPLLERLKTVIDQLPDPDDTQALEAIATLDDISFLSSQDDTSAPEFQDESFRKPRRAGGLNPELRTMIQNLQRQLEQQRQDTEHQRKDAEQQRAILMAQLERQRQDTEYQRKDAEQQRAVLMAQLERQRQESEQQWKDAEQQTALLMAQLERQRQESEEHRKEAEQQQRELVQLLKRQ
ncbi:uncharacterized protein A1O9_13139 [Exophiala aquamarina CBS 119918]|uniref:DUF7924 domain-containing protein n=1 Tax=Exophiala aquamarina CBS 119918 TaxID=1182545 RepID=A0A072NSJ4_9EURO|nr:uncharacterized protein A1O9_13139 [Exophiala aquamarina CBS 119918]KEF50809.1 hypothetical protein A1O9_13139 [Exophiala aquamarina CBS 119918]